MSVGDTTSHASQSVMQRLVQEPTLFLIFVFLVSAETIGASLEYEVPGIWPFNALALAVLVRFPRLHGFLIAVILVGISALHSIFASVMDANMPSYGLWEVFFCLSNVIGVFAGYVSYRGVPHQGRGLASPLALGYCLRAIIMAVLASALVDAIFEVLAVNEQGWSLVSAHTVITKSLEDGLNYIVVMPCILAFPHGKKMGAIGVRTIDLPTSKLFEILPCLALVSAIIAGMMMRGTGSLIFPIPALLLCAFTYTLFSTTLLVFLWGMLALVMIGVPSTILVPWEDGEAIKLSAQVGIGLGLLCPLMVASAVAAHNDLMVRMRVLAEEDPLTGLANRRGFWSRARESLTFYKGKSASLAVMILDLDHFKQVNDTFGHDQGDRVLVAFSNILMRCAEAPNLVGRLGGEEFVILLPRGGVDHMKIVAQRIEQALRNLRLQSASGKQMPITASIGGHAATSVSKLSLLMAQADQALYRAKRSGRNCCILTSNTKRAIVAKAFGPHAWRNMDEHEGLTRP